MQSTSREMLQMPTNCLDHSRAPQVATLCNAFLEKDRERIVRLQLHADENNKLGGIRKEAKYGALSDRFKYTSSTITNLEDVFTQVSWRERHTLAVTLTSSVLQFGGTDIMGRLWAADGISLARSDQEHGGQWLPFVSQPLSRPNANPR